MGEAKRIEIAPELVRRAQAGDEAAFNQLYEQTGTAIYRTIFSMVQNEETAWDIHQNTYLLAWRGLHKLEKPEAFLAWLRRIAVNEAVKTIKKEEPLRFSELADDEDEEPQFADERDGYQPEIELDKKEAARLVRGILEKMPKKQKLIVGMYYYEEYSIKEIAEALNITQGTVKTQLHLGRKRVEAEVRRLEGEGVKLYGMAPMAFFTFLLRNQGAGTLIGKRAAQAALTKAAATEPTVLTAKAVGSGFFHTALGKLTALALSGAVVAGGVLGYHALQKLHQSTMGDYRPSETVASTEPLPVALESNPVSTTAPQETQPEPQTEPQSMTSAEHADPISGSCGENLTWTFYPDSGLLAIEGSGSMEDYQISDAGWVSDHDRPWKSFRDDIVSISLPEGLTHIGSDAFRYCASLKSKVSLPEGLQSIGSMAFDGCFHLSEVSFPQSLISLDAWAFANTGLTGVTLPKGLTELSEYAFSGCTNLTDAMLPSKLRSIGEGAFNECTNLTNIMLPSKLSSIGEAAFYHCSALTSVTIPASVEEIGRDAFGRCDTLLEINVDENNPFYGSLDGVLYTHYNEKLRYSVIVLCPAGKTGTYVMGNTVYEIGDSAFAGCQGLTEITFSENLSGIGAYAFSGCSGLKSVTLPASVEGLGVGAFTGCTALTQVLLPELKSIQYGTFSNCTSLRRIVLPNYMRQIESAAFSGCTSLSDVSLPSSLTTIDYSAFSGCASLKQIAIPDGVTELVGAFDGCSALEAFKVAAGNSTFSSVDGVLYDKEQRVLIKYPEGKKNDTFTIPANVTEMEDYSWNCPYLTEINVAAGNRAYSSLDGVLFNADQTELIRVPCCKQGVFEIPQSVRVIQPFSLQNCAELTELTIPANVPYVGTGYNLFTGCSSLTAINVAAENEAYSSLDGVLFNKAQSELFYCPEGKAGVYTIPANVEYFSESAFDACALLTEINVVPENENFSSIDGVLFNKAQTRLIRFPRGKQGDYVIPQSVTSLYSSFQNCSKLTSVTIPNGVQSLESFTFGGCPALKSVTIPASVTHFNPFVFGGNGVCEEVQEGFILYGVPGSAAQSMAENYGFCFVPISE